MKSLFYALAIIFLFLAFIELVKERSAGISFFSGKGFYFVIAFLACIGIMILTDKLSSRHNKRNN